MIGTKCRFAGVARIADAEEGLLSARCDVCSVTAAELENFGLALEICGAEHYSDPTTGERYSVAIAICPECHHHQHLTPQGDLNPCHVRARLSWERFV